MSPKNPLDHLPATAIGTKQEIQARSGTATFVPKGHTIKIINSYGSQTVAVWAFALHEAPTEEEMEAERAEMDQPDQAEDAVSSGRDDDSGEKSQSVQKQDPPTDPNNEAQSGAPEAEKPHETNPAVENTDEAANVAQSDPDGQKGSSEDTGPKKSWTSYIPSIHGRSKPATGPDVSQDTDPSGEKGSSAPRKWTSYIPSVPAAKKRDSEKKEHRTWASYIPSGHGFSSYIPKDALHAISEAHKRDPNKSVAEQLVDFSKTPAGAAGLSSKATTSPSLWANRNSRYRIWLC
jgi:hypothetical protein